MAGLTLSAGAGTASGALTGAKIGSAFGPIGTGVGAVLGALAGSLGPKGPSRRHTRITMQRVEGNIFAQGCAAYGVGSTVCPKDQLIRWTQLSQRRYPNAYRQVFLPLLEGGPQPQMTPYLQDLLFRYLDKRQAAPSFQSVVQSVEAYLPGGAPGRVPQGYTQMRRLRL